MKSKASEYLGKTFGRLTVLEVVKTNKPRTYFKCRCQCGNESIVSLNCIQAGKTKSCGCLSRELVIKRNKSEDFRKKVSLALKGNTNGKKVLKEMLKNE